MNCYSKMVGAREFIYTDTKKKKKVWVATFKKGKIFAVNYCLEFGIYNGYFFKKGLEYEPEDEVAFLIDKDNSFPWNITRICLNRKSWLGHYKKLAYQKRELTLAYNPYKEKELREKYSHNVEFLEKYIVSRNLGYPYMSLFTPKVLELNGSEAMAFIKYLKDKIDDLTSYGSVEMLRAFKGGYKTFKEYEHSRNIKKLCKLFKFDKEDAEYFIKNYTKTLGFKEAVRIYDDTLKLANKLGKSAIGFPKDLLAYERELIELDKEIKNKKSDEKLINTISKFILKDKKLIEKGYEPLVLKSTNEFSRVADEFQNCIYSTYFSKCVDGKYMILLLKKNNEDYACVGFNKVGKHFIFDQAYKKCNEIIEKSEYNFIKENLKVSVRA